MKLGKCIKPVYQVVVQVQCRWLKIPLKLRREGANKSASNNNGIALSKQFSFAEILPKASAVGVSSFGPEYCCLSHFN